MTDEERGMENLAAVCNDHQHHVRGVGEPMANHCSDATKKEPVKCCRESTIFRALVTIITFLCASSLSLPAPILPLEASDRGISATQCGLVLGIFELVMLVTTPIMLKLLTVFKPRILLRLAALFSGITIILFGLLHYIESRTTFLALTYVVYALNSLGITLGLNACYTIYPREHPDNIGMAYSVLEVAFAGGVTVGPFISGGFYEIGGYPLPFCVIGGTELFACLILVISTDNGTKDNQNRGGCLKLLKQKPILEDYLGIAVVAAVLSFNIATLQYHLQQFHLSAVVSSLIFTIDGGVDAIIAPLFGYLADRVKDAQLLALLGLFFAIVSMVIVGPAPFIPMSSTLWLIILSQVLLGMATCSVIVSGMAHSIRVALERGFPDEVSTYAMISSMFLISYTLGSTIGPSMGGYLLDCLGYKYATMCYAGIVIVGVSIILVLKYGAVICCCCQKKPRSIPLSVQSS